MVGKKVIKGLILLLAILVTFALATSIFRGNRNEAVEVVGDLDFTKYTGIWYKIARIENKTEKNCVADGAEYSLSEDGKISFSHYCNIRGKVVKKSGTAKFVDSPDYGRLDLKNDGVLDFFSYRYNIVVIGSEYSFAVVSGKYTNGESFVWLLSRQERMDYKLFLDAVDSMKEHNLDIDRLVYVSHS